MKRAGQGFSLVELMVTVAILALLLALGLPSYRIWIGNMKIRTAAESIQNGLQLARGEAVRRNAPIRFQLVSTLGSDCALSTVLSNWVVSYDDPTGKCDHVLLNDTFLVTDETNNPAPRMIQSRPAAEGSSKVVLAADQSEVTFNGLGRVSNAANPVKIEVTDADGSCVAAGGALRCLRVTVTPGGQVRMCDPAFSIAGNDPQRCSAGG